MRKKRPREIDCAELSNFPTTTSSGHEKYLGSSLSWMGPTTVGTHCNVISHSRWGRLTCTRNAFLEAPETISTILRPNPILPLTTTVRSVMWGHKQHRSQIATSRHTTSQYLQRIVGGLRSGRLSRYCCCLKTFRPTWTRRSTRPKQSEKDEYKTQDRMQLRLASRWIRLVVTLPLTLGIVWIPHTCYLCRMAAYYDGMWPSVHTLVCSLQWCRWMFVLIM